MPSWDQQARVPQLELQPCYDHRNANTKALQLFLMCWIKSCTKYDAHHSKQASTAAGPNAARRAWH